MIDPATGLPVDENGNILGAEQAGSNIISEGDAGAFMPDPPMPAALAPPVSTPASHPAARIPMPGEAVKQSSSADGSYKGITASGVAATTSLNKKADAAARADVAQFAPQYQEQEAEAGRIAGDRRHALALETEAIKQHAAQESELWMAQQHFIKEQHDLEKHAYAQSQVVRQQYMAAYENDLATAKMLAMQSGDPYENMSGGQAFGLIAAHAVAGFLKVGGHNIDVAAQTDRWVNREIAKHGQKVQDARAAANDQFHLYGLARQNSQDDYEARERYRGMVLEGMKSQVMAEAARYNSQLANATAAQKAAEIDAQLLGIKTNLADKQQKMYFDAQQMRIQQASEQARNSVAWYTAKTGRMEEERKAKEEKAKAEALKPPPARIADPGATVRDTSGKIVGLKNVYEIDERAPDSHKAEFLKTQTRYAGIMEGARLLRELRPPAMNDFVEKYGQGTGTAARFSEAMRNYERQKTHTIQSARHAVAGANLTDQERAEWNRLLENDSGWQSGDNHAAIDQLEMRFRNEFNAAMKSPYIRVIPEHQQDERPVPNTANDTDSSYEGALRAKAPQTSLVDKAAAGTVKVGRNEVAAPGFSATFSEYMKKTGDYRGADPSERGQRGEIDAVDQLAALVLRPELGVDAAGTVEGKPTVEPELVRNDAYRALADIAAGKKNADGTTPDQEAQQYAAFLKSKVDGGQDDYEQLYKAISERAVEQVASPADDLESGAYNERMRTQQRADFLRKGITGQ